VALEQDADLVRLASGLLEREPNIQVTQGALIEGFKAGGLYDVIFVNGATENEPATLLSQLEEGGRLVAFEQSGPQGRAVLYIKEHSQVGRRAGFDATVPLLAGFKKHVGFIF
jgi:protein-L-isoaspartate(D-aspartate) O-methyltransferase